jgi:hypothetical protein
MFHKFAIIALAVAASASAAVAAPATNFTAVPGADRPIWSSRLFHRAQMSGCQTCQYEFQRCQWRCDSGNYGGFMTYNQCLGVCGVATQACMQNFC